jgi:hypothetical protein
MLVYIYDHAINAIREGVEILDGSAEGEIVQARLNAQRKVLLIIDGLAIDEGGTPVDVLRLCLFVFDKVQTDSVDDWAAAQRILETLREGFAGIQEEAREAEKQGLIPPLDTVAS